MPGEGQGGVDKGIGFDQCSVEIDTEWQECFLLDYLRGGWQNGFLPKLEPIIEQLSGL